MRVLEQQMQRVCFEIMQREFPGTVEVIRKLVNAGETPKKIEEYIRSNVPIGPGVGQGNLTVNAVFYTARHIQMGLG